MALVFLRIVVSVVRVLGLVATVDSVANGIGLGAIVAPFEEAFDDWITNPVVNWFASHFDQP
jgi:hypothetical protein